MGGPHPAHYRGCQRSSVAGCLLWAHEPWLPATKMIPIFAALVDVKNSFLRRLSSSPSSTEASNDSGGSRLTHKYRETSLLWCRV